MDKEGDMYNGGCGCGRRVLCDGWQVSGEAVPESFGIRQVCVTAS